MRYRVTPGLYRLGTPDGDSPVLVTANYKLTFDRLRSSLGGVEAWLLVLDTRGVNVWCAAGKGTFGTDELVRQIECTRLADRVTHRRLVVPQLGATGIAARQVRNRTGFKVVFGPVRAADLGAYLAAGMRATEAMRRVTFTLRERLEVVGNEVTGILKWMALCFLVLAAVGTDGGLQARLAGALHLGAPLFAGFLCATVLVPLALPWIPGRAFALKGALAGALVVGATLALTHAGRSPLGALQLFTLGTAVASFFAMHFTGATTYTSPSGVEWEMRRALPLQVGAAMLALALFAARPFVN
jgi:hypothetical protein